MTRAQMWIGLGICLGVASLAALFLWARPLVPAPSDADEAAARLAFAAPWLLAPAAALGAGILYVAVGRFFSPDALDGRADPASPGLRIALRYVQNTTEQAVLAIPVWLALALWAPLNALWALPLCAFTFLAGRALFWIGYRIAPPARAFGFVLTFYPTLAALLVLLRSMACAAIS